MVLENQFPGLQIAVRVLQKRFWSRKADPGFANRDHGFRKLVPGFVKPALGFEKRDQGLANLNHGFTKLAPRFYGSQSWF